MIRYPMIIGIPYQSAEVTGNFLVTFFFNRNILAVWSFTVTTSGPLKERTLARPPILSVMQDKPNTACAGPVNDSAGVEITL